MNGCLYLCVSPVMKWRLTQGAPLRSAPARDPEKDGGGVTVVDAAIIINQSLFVQRQVTTKELLFYTFVRSADVLCFD